MQYPGFNLTDSVILTQTQTMNFCPYSQGWLYRKGYRFTLAEAQRSQRKRIKQYCLCKKHMSPLRSLRLCEKTVC